MDIFTLGLFFLIVLCGLLYYYTYKVSAVVKDANFVRFQRIYLIVYLLAMCKFNLFFFNIYFLLYFSSIKWAIGCKDLMFTLCIRVIT